MAKIRHDVAHLLCPLICLVESHLPLCMDFVASSLRTSQSAWCCRRLFQLITSMASSLALASRKGLFKVCSIPLFRRNIHITAPCCYYVEGAHEPFAPIPDRFPRWATSGEDAFGHLKDGAKVFVHGGAATPSLLVKELHQYVMSRGIKDVQLLHIHTEGPFPFNDPECAGHFRTNSLFTGTSDP